METVEEIVEMESGAVVKQEISLEVVRTSDRLETKRRLKKRARPILIRSRGATLEIEKDTEKHAVFEERKPGRPRKRPWQDNDGSETSKPKSGGKTPSRKIFDYESAIREIKELKEKQKEKSANLVADKTATSTETAAVPSTGSVTAPSSVSDIVLPSTSKKSLQLSSLMKKRSKDSGAQTEQTGHTSGNNYALLKSNVDLKWANEKLRKENAALQARVEILLDMLVQKSSQLKLLRMTCENQNVEDEV